MNVIKPLGAAPPTSAAATDDAASAVPAVPLAGAVSDSVAPTRVASTTIAWPEPRLSWYEPTTLHSPIAGHDTPAGTLIAGVKTSTGSWSAIAGASTPAICVTPWLRKA